MNYTKPIKSIKDVQKFKQYYLERGEYRNYLLVTICLNSALRISDVLNLKWEDFYRGKKRAVLKSHIELTEQKTGKQTTIYINNAIKKSLKLFIKKCDIIKKEGYIFVSDKNKPITRMQAYRIISRGGESIGLEISCHSLRKTFGYHAWKTGVPPVILMKIYNHSRFDITKRYLGIEQDDKDLVFKSMEL